MRTVKQVFPIARDNTLELQKFEQDVQDSQLSKTFKNKQRTLVFCARGTTTLYRHLMNDLR